MRRRQLAPIAMAVFVLACSDSRPSHPPTQPSRPPSPTATAARIDLGEVALSDAFWERNSEFVPTNYRFESLADIVADVHLIVRGRIVGTRDGELQSFGGSAMRRVTFGVVAIDEVLKGEPVMQVPGMILVARVGDSNQDIHEIPAGEVILFLAHYPRMRAELGVAQSIDPDDRFLYARPNGYQCVLRNLGGVVRIIDGPGGWEEALGPFPAQLDREPFSDVVGEIRATVAAS